MSEELQEKLIAVLAAMDEDEQQRLVNSMAALEKHTFGIVENSERALDVLDRFLGTLAKTDPEAIQPKEQTLCETCANPCSRTGREIVFSCAQYHQLGEYCDTCAYYDLDPRTGLYFCVFSGDCRGGEALATRVETYSV